MIISPFYQVSENEVLVAVRDIAYVVNTDTNEITEAEGQLPAEFLNLLEALHTFTFENNEIKWYHGVSRMRYSIEEGKFFLSNGEILKESFVNHVLNAGIIRYENKRTAELFVEAATNIEKYIALDFVKTFEGSTNVVDLFKLEENIYATTFNKSSRVNKLSTFSTANSALEYVTEKTGLDATEFLAESLEGEAAERVVVLNKVENLFEMIHFLKDQRNLLADADRSIEEIKAADALIEGEIKRLEAEVTELKATL
jgi:hypothetical protein